MFAFVNYSFRYYFADYIVFAMSAGFQGDKTTNDLSVNLTRLNFPYILFISLSANFWNSEYFFRIQTTCLYTGDFKRRIYRIYRFH